MQELQKLGFKSVNYYPANEGKNAKSNKASFHLFTEPNNHINDSG
jgi:hypothetical protein